MKILIYGGGAIGSLYAALLQKSGQDIILIGREEHIKKINKQGLIIKGKIDDRIKIPSFSDVYKINKKIDLIILTVKSYDTYSAMKKCKRFISNTTRIMSLQNGIENEGIVQKFTKNIIGGVTSNGVVFDSPGKIIFNSIGPTIIGNYGNKNDEFTNRVCDIFNKSGIDCKVSNNIKQELFKKFLVNVGLNGLASIVRVNNGEIIKNNELKYIFISIVYEAIKIGKSEGYKLPKGTIENIIKTIQIAAENTNSMLQDLDKHKKTEIDYLNGKVVELGRKYNTPTPYNQLITGIIRFFEKKSLK